MYSSSFSNLGPRCEWVVNATPGRSTPGKHRVPIVYKAVWATGPVWAGAEKLAAAVIRSSIRPARSQSLHRLSYPGPIVPSTAT